MIKKFTIRQIQEYEWKPNGNLDAWGADVSDGYHTMLELYDHRRALNVAFFNVLHTTKFASVGKSKQHSDGSMFEGYFVVFIEQVVYEVPTAIISYHYALEYWDQFQIPEYEKAPHYDGHVPSDVVNRLLSYI